MGNLYTPYAQGIFLKLGLLLLCSCSTLSSYAHHTTNSTLHTVEGETANVFFQTMCDNATNGGQIAGDETGCIDPVFDPMIITNAVLPTGGTGNLEYLWMFTTDNPGGAVVNWKIIPNSNTPFYDPEPIGKTTYYVRCVRRAGCEDYNAESNVVAKQVDDCGAPCTLDILLTSSDEACEGTANGTATIEILSGSGDYSYLWSNGANTPTINNLTAGMYEVTVTDIGAANCTATAATTITITNQSFQIIFETQNVTCSGGNDGTIDILIGGGEAPFEFEWSNNANTQNIDNLSEGTYELIVNDNNGCEVIASTEVAATSTILVDITSSNATCGENSGMAMAIPSGGTAPYTYLWSDDANQTNPIANNLGVGIYTLTVSDANGCTTTASTEVLDGGDVKITLNPTQPTCTDPNSGSIRVDVFSGAAPFSFDWDNAPDVEEPTNLASGTYCVTVTDINNCAASQCIILESAIDFAINLTAFNPNCGETNGAIDLEVSPADAFYTYHWDHLVDVQDPNNLDAGTYCVTVTDGAGCTMSDCITLDSGGNLAISLTASNPTCSNADGAITTEVEGTHPPYTFEWDNAPNVQNPTDLFANTYCVTVTDANNCVKIDCISLEGPAAIELSTTANNPSCGESNGSIDLEVSPTDGIYTYHWDHLTDVQDPMDLSAGNYCVTVTNADGCTASTCVALQAGSAVAISLEGTAPTCEGESDGSIELTILAGTAPLIFEWDNAPNVQNPTDLSAGNFCVSVSDNNGCIAVECIELLAPEKVNAVAAVTDPSCVGDSDGSIVLNVEGGTGDYTFAWDNGATTQTLTGLESGNYCVTISDSNSCTAFRCYGMFGPTPLQLTFDANPPLCNGDMAVLTAIPSGGTGDYTYLWDNDATSATISDLAIGTYCVTVTDEKLCEHIDCFEISEPEALAIAVTSANPTCTTGNDGLIDISVSGGTGAYTYTWDNGANTEDLENLTTGTYCITVSDENGCEENTCINLVAPALMNVNASMTMPLCQGDANGSIDLEVSGGTGTYTFTWDNNATSATINNLSAATYCVTIEDQNNCIYTDCYELNEPLDLALNFNTTNPLCTDDANGIVEAIAMGGTAPYAFVWEDDSILATRSDLVAGTYCVTITDANNCILNDCITLNNPDALTFGGMHSNPTCAGGNDGSINLNATGGTGVYTYAWDNGATSSSLSDLNAGVYCVTISDENGCTVDNCIALIDPTGINVSITANAPACNGDTNGSIELSATGGNGDYFFIWDDNTIEQNRTNLASGTYCVTVADGNNCTIEECIELVEPAILAVALTENNISCADVVDGSLDAEVTGGTMPYSYLWDDGTTVESISNLEAATYCITITDANNCTTSACATIEQPNALDIMAVGVAPTCQDDTDGSIDLMISGGLAPFEIDWDTTEDVEDPTNLSAGVYCVTVTDATGCTDGACVNIPNPDALALEFTSTGTSCANGDGSASVEALNGSGPYSYQWADPNNSTTPTITNLDAGWYAITVMDGNGCMAIDAVEVSFPPFEDCVDLVSIGDYAWLDANMNGLQDPTEIGIAGITVNLLSAGADGVFGTADDTIVDTQVTDNTGFYLFENVMPGQWVIEFVVSTLPNNTMITTTDAGANDALDSDANTFTGRTAEFTVYNGVSDNSLDIGIVYDCNMLINGGEICCDQEVCGSGANPDPITSVAPAIADLGVIEYLWLRNYTGSPFSDSDPDWIPIPNSNVESYDPVAVYQTTYFIRCSRLAYCDQFLGESNIIKVKVTEVPEATIENLPNQACTNEVLNVNAADGGALATYEWTFGGNANPATADTRFVNALSWATTGVKIVNLAVENNGCYNYAEETINMVSCATNGETSNRFTNFKLTEIAEKTLQLAWETNDNLNDYHFIIEYSRDGIIFEPIDAMEGHLAGDVKAYQCVDSAPNIGYNYYRVKHLNVDGSTESTDVQMFLSKITEYLDVNIYPNPFTEELHIEMLTDMEAPANVQLINAFGKVIKTFDIPANSRNYAVDLSDQAAGAYFLYIQYNEFRKKTMKIFKTLD